MKRTTSAVAALIARDLADYLNETGANLCDVRASVWVSVDGTDGGYYTSLQSSVPLKGGIDEVENAVADLTSRVYAKTYGFTDWHATATLLVGTRTCSFYPMCK